MMPDCAFLVYRPLKKRRVDNSFDGNDNIGALVIKDVLERAGIQVGFCAPETAHRYKLVLVSFTSTYDMYAYYQAVALRDDWQPGKRSFKVLGGGFGMQNPTVIRRYLDAAAFGRAEGFVVDVVNDMLNGRVPGHSSIMASFPEIAPVVFSQAETLYPYDINGWQEKFIGCVHKCKFCHYTFARENQNNESAYLNIQMKKATSADEVTWDMLGNYFTKSSLVRSAIDGFSERLRYACGKRISNKDIVDGIISFSRTVSRPITLNVYNIGNMPTETSSDREELDHVFSDVETDYRLTALLHTTPFRPSLLTPMQWEPVALHPSLRFGPGVFITKKTNFKMYHNMKQESPLSHLLAVIPDRATMNTDKLWHTMCFAKPSKASFALMQIKKHFDLTPILKQYDFDEPHPADFLTGAIAKPTLVKIAKKMREQLAIPYEEWRPTGLSMGEVMRKRREAKQE